MGCDTIIHLPYSAQVRHIGMVMGRLAGLSFTDTKGYIQVSGLKIVPGTDFAPEMLTIEMNAEGTTLVDGETGHYCYLHMESEFDMGKTLTPRSTAFWIAMGIRLVDFFGGSIVYNDSGSSLMDYMVPARDNTTETDFKYDAMMTRIKDLRPMTLTKMLAAEKHASYKDTLPNMSTSNV